MSKGIIICQQVFFLKEDLRQFWEKSRKSEAEKSLLSWIETAKSTNEPLLINLAKTIETHIYGLLSWYDFPINSGRIEGINNKIKLVKRKAFGYRDFNFFKLQIMAILRCTENLSFRVLNSK
ncbi:MAG: transposase [Deltaproteobacteria bacterium]|jgi:transposase|nr:transposase [Deltaproteobacteria bacterium]